MEHTNKYESVLEQYVEDIFKHPDDFDLENSLNIFKDYLKAQDQEIIQEHEDHDDDDDDDATKKCIEKFEHAGDGDDDDFNKLIENFLHDMKEELEEIIQESKFDDDYDESV